MRLLIRRLYILFCVATVPTSANASIVDACFYLGAYSYDYFAPIRPLQLNAEQSKRLAAWAHKYALDWWIGIEYREDLAALIVNRLDPDIKEAVFKVDGQELSVPLAVRRLAAYEPVHIDPGTLSWFSSGPAPWVKTSQFLKNWEDQIRSYSPEKIKALESEIEWRIVESKGRRLLGEQFQPEYEIKIEGDFLRVPDGKKYKIEKRRPDGRLSFDVDYYHILRVEDYRAVDRINWYIKDMTRNPKVYEYGIYSGKDQQPNGALVADGRFILILEGHARAEAYAAVHDGKVRVEIAPASNGKYYAMTHFAVLNFYTVWKSVDEARQKAIFEAANISPINAIRDTYYEIMKRYSGQFPRLE